MYLEKVREIYSKSQGRPINNKELADSLSVSESFVSQRRKAIVDSMRGLQLEKNPILDKRTLYKIEHNVEQFWGLSPSNLTDFYKATNWYECTTLQERTVVESFCLRLRKSFSSGVRKIISQRDLDEKLGIKIKQGLERDRSVSQSVYLFHTISLLWYKITRLSTIGFDKTNALFTIKEIAEYYSHPLALKDPEVTFIEVLKYAIADETNEFLTNTKLSELIGLGKGWASGHYSGRSNALREDSLNSLSTFIDNYFSLQESQKLAKFAYLNYKRFERMATVRSKAASMVTLHITNSGKHKLWVSKRHTHYRVLMKQQMGMDALTGDSICPQDIVMSQLDRHHWNYKKWSILESDLVLLNRSSHGSVVHPSKYFSNYRSWLPMMWKQVSRDRMFHFEEVKNSFENLKPPDHWSPTLKNSYNQRKNLYLAYGFKVFQWFSQGNP